MNASEIFLVRITAFDLTIKISESVDFAHADHANYSYRKI